MVSFFIILVFGVKLSISLYIFSIHKLIKYYYFTNIQIACNKRILKRVKSLFFNFIATKFQWLLDNLVYHTLRTKKLDDSGFFYYFLNTFVYASFKQFFYRLILLTLFFGTCRELVISYFFWDFFYALQAYFHISFLRIHYSLFFPYHLFFKHSFVFLTSHFLASISFFLFF